MIRGEREGGVVVLETRCISWGRRGMGRGRSETLGEEGARRLHVGGPVDVPLQQPQAPGPEPCGGGGGGRTEGRGCGEGGIRNLNIFIMQIHMYRRVNVLNSSSCALVDSLTQTDKFWYVVMCFSDKKTCCDPRLQNRSRLRPRNGHRRVTCEEEPLQGCVGHERRFRRESGAFAHRRTSVSRNESRESQK